MDTHWEFIEKHKVEELWAQENKERILNRQNIEEEKL